MPGRQFELCDGIMRYDATIVFHSDLQIHAGNHALRQLQNFCDPIRSESMTAVATHMHLQQNFLLSSGESAAINEVPDHMPNLSEVSVRRNGIAIRQHKSQEPVGICLERILQIRERHGCSIYLLRYVLKRKLRLLSLRVKSRPSTTRRRLLPRRTRHRSITAEDAAVAGLRFQLRAAGGAIVKIEAGIERHFFCGMVPTLWAGNDRLLRRAACSRGIARIHSIDLGLSFHWPEGACLLLPLPAKFGADFHPTGCLRSDEQGAFPIPFL